MGLDMWVFSREVGAEDRNEIAYWRKFNALHNYMEKLYRERGGEEDFNCVPVQLYKEDLLKLQRTILDNELKPTGGFFFGPQEIYPKDEESTLIFISRGLYALSQGQEVFYDSWW